MFFQEEINSARQKHTDLFIESLETWLRRTSQVTLQSKLDVDISWGLLPFAELKRVLSKRDKKNDLQNTHSQNHRDRRLLSYIKSQSSQAGLWVAKGWTRNVLGCHLHIQIESFKP
jgi:hypothetical protein